MEQHRHEASRKQPKAPELRPQGKPKRFRIVKLEERIAPKKKGTQDTATSDGGFCLSIE
jgi:hypothetical protein